MSTNLQFWNDCYSNGNTGWDRGGVHPFIISLLNECLLKPCSIIVPGCGRGYEVLELAKRGFDVTGIDIATEPLQHLQNKLGGYEANSQVVQQSIFDFRPAQSVDAVYEQTCLCAIDPAQRALYEQAVFDWLSPTGKLLVLFVQKAKNPTEGPPFHCGLEEMRKLFPESRWTWPASDPVPKYEHPSGKMFELGFVLTKRTSTAP